MLDAGYPLSAVTEALCARWQPGVRLLPTTDDRVETHVVVDATTAGQKAIHFQEWWVRHRGAVPTHRFVFVGADAAKPAPGVLDAHRRGRRGAARAEQPGGERRADPGRAGAARGGRGRPGAGGRACRRSSAARRCAAWPTAAWPRSAWSAARPAWAALRRRAAGGLLDGWLVDDGATPAPWCPG